jgi:hypothetical protein
MPNPNDEIDRVVGIMLALQAAGIIAAALAVLLYWLLP